MKVTIEKAEVKEIVKKHLEVMFPDTQVSEGTGSYGDFEFDVIKKEQSKNEKNEN